MREPQTNQVFVQQPVWSVALLMIGACIGAVAVTMVYMVLGVVQVG